VIFELDWNTYRNGRGLSTRLGKKRFNRISDFESVESVVSGNNIGGPFQTIACEKNLPRGGS